VRAANLDGRHLHKRPMAPSIVALGATLLDVVRVSGAAARQVVMLVNTCRRSRHRDASYFWRKAVWNDMASGLTYWNAVRSIVGITTVAGIPG
jgi:hypothetical protein